MRKKGAILSYVFMFLEMLSSVLFTPFLIRSFGQSEYGIYTLVCSITSYLMLLDLGIGNAMVRYMSKYRVLNDKKNQSNMLAITLIFYLLVGFLVVILGSLLKQNTTKIFSIGLSSSELLNASKMLGITMLNVAITFIFSPFSQTINAFEKFVFLKLASIVKIILRVGISVIVLFVGGKGLAIVTLNFVLTILFGFIYLIYVVFKLKVIPVVCKVDLGFIKEIVGYSLFIFIQMVATQINAMADHILIGMFVPASATILAVYGVGAQINQYFQSIAGSINGLLMPGVVRMVEQGANSEELCDEMIKIGRLIFMFIGIIWGVFVVIGDSFIVLWAGEINKNAYLVAVILMTPMMFVLIQSIGTQILWAKNKHRFQAYLKMIIVVINVGATILLIKWNPLVGASLGTAASILMGDIIVMNIVFKKDIKISFKKYYTGLFKGIVPSILLTMLAGFCLNWFVEINTWIELFATGALLAIAYSIIMYNGGMNFYEKGLIKNIICKILIKK